MLEIDDQKTGVGAYTDKSFVCITQIYTVCVQVYVNNRIIKKGWALTRTWALTRENTVYTCTNLLIEREASQWADYAVHLRQSRSTASRLNGV